MRINDDITKAVTVDARRLEWTASPAVGVDRRMAMEHRDAYQSEAAALTAIADKLGCLPDSLRVWMRQV